eukprot:4946628-Pyramimonas_sp.AAC.1
MSSASGAAGHLRGPHGACAIESFIQVIDTRVDMKTIVTSSSGVVVVVAAVAVAIAVAVAVGGCPYRANDTHQRPLYINK